MKIRKKESRVRGRVWFSLRWLLQQEILLAMSTHLAYVFCNNINLTAQEMNLVFHCKDSRWYLLFAFLAGCPHFISVTMISYPNAKQESDPGKRMIFASDSRLCSIIVGTSRHGDVSTASTQLTFSHANAV